MGKPATHLTRPMSNLVELGYIRRETPFGENEKKSRRSLYKIDDPYLAFIFRYLEPNRSRLEMGATHQVYDEIERNIPHHVGNIWEDLARASAQPGFWMHSQRINATKHKIPERGRMIVRIDSRQERTEGGHSCPPLRRCAARSLWAKRDPLFTSHSSLAPLLLIFY